MCRTCHLPLFPRPSSSLEKHVWRRASPRKTKEPQSGVHFRRTYKGRTPLVQESYPKGEEKLSAVSCRVAALLLSSCVLRVEYDLFVAISMMFW
jgi:hypothetical protein